jgi:hypothetical protein
MDQLTLNTDPTTIAPVTKDHTFRCSRESLDQLGNAMVKSGNGGQASQVAAWAMIHFWFFFQTESANEQTDYSFVTVLLPYT